MTAHILLLTLLVINIDYGNTEPVYATTNGVKYVRATEAVLLDCRPNHRSSPPHCQTLDLPLQGKNLYFVATFHNISSNGVATYHIRSHYSETLYTTKERNRIQDLEKRVEQEDNTWSNYLDRRKKTPKKDRSTRNYYREKARKHRQKKADFNKQIGELHRTAKSRRTNHRHTLLVRNHPEEHDRKVGLKITNITTEWGNFKAGEYPTLTIHGDWIPVGQK